MNTTIEITPNAELQSLFRRAASLPQRVLQAVGAALTVSGQIITGNAVKYRFTDQRGPFPHAEHKLGRVSGRLRQSLTATPPQVEADGRTVSMGFGSNVKYFGIHEFGFSGPVAVRSHSRRNGQQVRAHQRFVNLQARAPMTTELEHPRTTDVIMAQARRRILAVVADAEGGPA